MLPEKFDRRQFLQYGSASVLAGGLLGSVSQAAGNQTGLIKSIERTVATSGFDGVYCWVHPRAGAIPGETPSVVMTMQHLWLKGSDVFQPLKEMRTDDLGKSWSGPSDTTFAHRDEEGEVTVGVCDFTPQWHAKTGKLLGVGHTVRYKDIHVQKGRRKRETSYAVYDNEKRAWSDWDVVQMPDMQNKFYHAGAGCAQRVDLPNGEILIPYYFSDGNNPFRKATVMRCQFDGEKLSYLEYGTEIDIPTERGALEPSLTFFQDEYFMTIRHGDGHGYVARSKDGLNFEPHQPWKWDDGSVLSTGDTQQHWVSHQEGLYLVFTYKRDDNKHVFRQRAPLFMAEVNAENLTLKKDTLQVLVPERGARLGNFAVATVSPHETWVTVAEWMQPVGCEKYGSDNSVYAVKIKWSKPNEYAVG
ncbi:MAG: sialidase family protein [Planctomycetaceae bacterium]